MSQLTQEQYASPVGRAFGGDAASDDYRAWITGGPNRPMLLERFDPGPLGPEEVEIAVEHCGLCHSGLSIWNNDWGISQYPAVLGHEVTGRISALGFNTKGLVLGQRAGVGWASNSCMHCLQCISGNHNLCPQPQFTIVGHRGGFASRVRAQDWGAWL